MAANGDFSWPPVETSVRHWGDAHGRYPSRVIWRLTNRLPPISDTELDRIRYARDPRLRSSASASSGRGASPWSAGRRGRWGAAGGPRRPPDGPADRHGRRHSGRRRRRHAAGGDGLDRRLRFGRDHREPPTTAGGGTRRTWGWPSPGSRPNSPPLRGCAALRASWMSRAVVRCVPRERAAPARVVLGAPVSPPPGLTPSPRAREQLALASVAAPPRDG